MDVLTQQDVESIIEKTFKTPKYNIELSQKRFEEFITINLADGCTLNLGGSQFRSGLQINCSGFLGDDDTLTIDARRTHFVGGLRLDSDVRSDLRFDHALFNAGMTCSYQNIRSLSLRSVQAVGDFDFSGNRIENFDFSGSVFKLPSTIIYLNNSEFTQSFNFSFAEIENIECSSCRFDCSVSFLESVLHNRGESTGKHFTFCEFNQVVNFNCKSIQNDIFFTGSTFKKVFRLISNKTETGSDLNLELSNCLFEEDVFLNGSFFSSLTITNSKFKGFTRMNNIFANYLDLTGSTFANRCDFASMKIVSNYHSYSIIHKELVAMNNQAEALDYQAKMIKAHENDLSWRKNIGDKIAFRVNWFSNRNGTNWLRAFGLTILYSVLAFVIYLKTLGAAASFSEMIKGYFNFIIVTHNLNFMENYCPSGLSYVVDSISRIILGYGIVQTVQAFRKLSKG